MLVPNENIWESGFNAGNDSGSGTSCPYPHDSPEAEKWYAGWFDGRRSYLDLCCDEPQLEQRPLRRLLLAFMTAFR